MQSSGIEIEVETGAADEEMNAIATSVNCRQSVFLNYYFMQNYVSCRVQMLR